MQITLHFTCTNACARQDIARLLEVKHQMQVSEVLLYNQQLHCKIREIFSPPRAAQLPTVYQLSEPNRFRVSRLHPDGHASTSTNHSYSTSAGETKQHKNPHPDSPVHVPRDYDGVRSRGVLPGLAHVQRVALRDSPHDRRRSIPVSPMQVPQLEMTNVGRRGHGIVRLAAAWTAKMVRLQLHPCGFATTYVDTSAGSRLSRYCEPGHGHTLGNALCQSEAASGEKRNDVSV